MLDMDEMDVYSSNTPDQVGDREIIRYSEQYHLAADVVSLVLSIVL